MQKTFLARVPHGCLTCHVTLDPASKLEPPYKKERLIAMYQRIRTSAWSIEPILLFSICIDLLLHAILVSASKLFALRSAERQQIAVCQTIRRKKHPRPINALFLLLHISSASLQCFSIGTHNWRSVSRTSHLLLSMQFPFRLRRRWTSFWKKGRECAVSKNKNNFVINLCNIPPLPLSSAPAFKLRYRKEQQIANENKYMLLEPGKLQNSPGLLGQPSQMTHLLLLHAILGSSLNFLWMSAGNQCNTPPLPISSASAWELFKLPLKKEQQNCEV